MAQAIVARENGDDYQRLVLWTYITKYLNNKSNIEKIYHEFDEVKGFDDIIIDYRNPEIIKGDRTVEKEYVQVKYHQYQSDFITIDNLIDPKFINSKSKSFLEKVKDAHDQLKNNYGSCIFTLYTPFDIDQNDTLYAIVDNHSRMINEGKFFDNTIRTQRAKDKMKLMNYLNVTEEELKIILSRVRFYKGLPIEELTDSLNIQLASVKLIPISKETVSNSYISLAKNWLLAGHLKLTKEFILSECNREKLISLPEEKNSRFAIKTFENNTTYLSEQNIETLDIFKLFKNGKFIREGHKWQDIYQNIKEFIKDKENTQEVYSVHLECSLTTAFLAGRVLNPKSGICAYPMQKTFNGIFSWKDEPVDGLNAFEDLCICDEYMVNEGGAETLLMVSITNDIEKDVLEYLDINKVTIGKVYHVKSKNYGANSIKNGMQSWNVANYIAKLMGTRGNKEKREMTHVFVSAPAALMFSMGKLSLNMGKLSFYEHDMKFTEEDLYIKSAIFPMEGE